jgi:hypothetical protein
MLPLTSQLAVFEAVNLLGRVGQKLCVPGFIKYEFVLHYFELRECITFATSD